MHYATYNYYEENATESYYNQYSTYPGLNYVVQERSLPEGKELWLRIEIEHNLFAGFCAYDRNLQSETGKGSKLLNMEDSVLQEYKKIFDEQFTITQEDWWLNWIYLPSNKMNEVPNFKKMNDAAVALADEATRRKFVAKCVQKIEKELIKQLVCDKVLTTRYKINDVQMGILRGMKERKLTDKKSCTCSLVIEEVIFECGYNPDTITEELLELAKKPIGEPLIEIINPKGEFSERFSKVKFTQIGYDLFG